MARSCGTCSSRYRPAEKVAPNAEPIHPIHMAASDVHAVRQIQRGPDQSKIVDGRLRKMPDYILAKPNGIAPSFAGDGVSYLDMRFEQVQVTSFSTRGMPYARWVDVGMPAISPAMLVTVVYLYPDVKSALEGDQFGGSGFVVGVASKTRPHCQYLYFVTNYHVAVKPRSGKPSPIVRLNTKDGGVDAIQFDQTEWMFFPGLGDVAAVPARINHDVHSVNFFSIDCALTKEETDSNSIGVGDDVFMIGRFIDHDGGQTNSPAVRFGNISVAPSYIPDMPNSGIGSRYFCLDMHSRSGFSGSPIVVYRTPGSDVRGAFNTTSMNLPPPLWRLLGIQCAQFPEDMKLKVLKGSGDVVVGYSGMNCALPIWSVIELLNCDKFANDRAAQDLQWQNTNYPTEQNSAGRGQ